jgi:Spy/CpxP family protein refolding chaperone
MKRILTGALALVLITGAAQAQSQKDTTGHRHRDGHHTMMKQLNLTPDQQAKFKAIRENQHKEMEALKTKALTSDQVKTQRKELHKKYHDQMQLVLTPAQKEQMKNFKAEKKKTYAEKGQRKKGGKGVNKRSGDFQKELNLTQAQKDELSKMRRDVKGQMESIRDDQSLTQDQKKEKIHSIKKDQKEKFKSVLTKEQLDKLETTKKERKDRVTK